jgi:hypothetical protein
MTLLARIYLFLFLLAIIPLIAIRELRDSLVAKGAGLALVALLLLSVAVLRIQIPQVGARQFWGSALLIAPFTLFGLFWIGLATPWEATIAENRMRYLVLMASAVVIALGFGLLGSSQTVTDSYWSVFSRFGALLAGAAYLIWTCFQAGMYDHALRHDGIPESLKSLNDVFDVLLFAAGILHYLSTACLALAISQIGALGRRATGSIVVASMIAMILLCVRGLPFPNPTAAEFAWHQIPGFVVGIPAVPWLFSYVLAAFVMGRR